MIFQKPDLIYANVIQEEKNSILIFASYKSY